MTTKRTQQPLSDRTGGKGRQRSPSRNGNKQPGYSGMPKPPSKNDDPKPVDDEGSK